MRSLILFLVLILQGCAAAPAYIPTGNPITDVLVTAAVQEAGSALARELISGQGGPASSLLSMLSPQKPWGQEYLNPYGKRHSQSGSIIFCDE